MALLLSAGAAAASDAWIDAVRSFTPGASAGFGAEDLPWIVLGPPEGAGLVSGSFDVVSLGHGGSIEVVFRDNVVFDGPGDDLVIFENAFHAGSETGPIFTEYAYVEVSLDGRQYQRFPFDAETGVGLAGRTAVLANSENAMDPMALESGGDRFDLAALGLPYVRYVRLIDTADEVPDFGNLSFPGTKGGFDLDAVGALHSTKAGRIRGVVLDQGVPAAGIRVVVQAAAGGRRRLRRSRDDGSFAVRRLAPSGDYRVKAKASATRKDQAWVTLAHPKLRAEVVLNLP